jgi:RimJ/RimL family protein N-acetyltransferase
MGERIHLREVVASDAVSLFSQLADDTQVQRHISPPPPSIIAFHGFISWCHRQRAEGQSICFAVVPNGLEHAVGIFQVRALGLDFSIAEWGFALGSAFWSTGIFEEGAALVAEFAFNTLGTFRLEGRAVTINGRGNGALNKLGAASEGVLRRALERDDMQHDQFIWGLLAEDWRARTGRFVRKRFSEDLARKTIEAAMAEVQSQMFKSAATESPLHSVTLHPFFINGRRRSLESSRSAIDRQRKP